MFAGMRGVAWQQEEGRSVRVNLLRNVALLARRINSLLVLSTGMRNLGGLATACVSQVRQQRGAVAQVSRTRGARTDVEYS